MHGDDIFGTTPFGSPVSGGTFKCKYCGKEMSDNIDGYCLDCYYSGKRISWREKLVKRMGEMNFD